MMKKKDLVEKYIEQMELIKENEGIKITKKDATVVIDTVFDLITESIVKDGGLDIFGFGKFEVVQRAERKGRNPQTSEEITIPASKAPKFRPSKRLKDAVNQ